ncbi:MAG: FAD-binding protein [Hyphomicrobiales bacterium]|nr:MAG: FAD-binding protein [Hyphomicrobiales bacterium]
MPRYIHEVVIAGGGLGGLTTAYLLRNAGMHVTVLEQAPEFGEVGAGIQTAPNASRILIHNGLRGQLEKVATAPTHQVRRRWADGRIVASRPLGDVLWTEFGAPYWHFHRADLHQVLIDACTDPYGIGDPVELQTSAWVIEVDQSDPNRPVAVTEDGRRFPADVVIGADGISSKVRQAIGLEPDLVFSRQITYRAMIPGSKLRADPTTRFLFDSFHSTMWWGPGRTLVHYFLRDGDVLNVGATGLGTLDPGTPWVRDASVDELVNAYAGWDDRVAAILSKAEGPVTKWALFAQRRTPCWVNNRVALLGDAAHAMTPNQAQGASQAIEDAAVLAEELAMVSTRNVDQALVVYNARRRRRAGMLQEASMENRRLYMLPDGPDQEARDAKVRTFQGESHVSYEWLWGANQARDLDPIDPTYPFSNTSRPELSRIQQEADEV